MSIKGITCILIVVSLGIVGCNSDKTPPQKPEASKTTAPSANPAGQQASPAVSKETPAASSSTKTDSTTPAKVAPETAAAVTPPAEPTRKPDVIFVPTPPEVVDKMLELAQVSKNDLVYDLGCGDGRIVVTAAKKFGCKAFGFDIDPQRIKESNENVQKEGVGNLVTIEQKDIFTLDLSNVNVVTLYLLPSLNVKLIPQLEKLKPGSRIVSHDFDMAGVTPDQVVKVTSSNGAEHSVYLWTTPLKKEAGTPAQ